MDIIVTDVKDYRSVDFGEGTAITHDGKTVQLTEEEKVCLWLEYWMRNGSQF